MKESSYSPALGPTSGAPGDVPGAAGAPAPKRGRALVLMGAAGSGKTTLGKELERRTGAPFFDADDEHDEAARDKMRRGVPLDDRDRLPWLARLRARLDASREAAGSTSEARLDATDETSETPPKASRGAAGAHAGGLTLILACSALKRSYRALLGVDGEGVRLVSLRVPAGELERRLVERNHPFAGPELLESQLATLEPPLPEERALELDGARPVDELADAVLAWLSGTE